MKLLKIDLDLIKIIQFWTFWTFLLKPPQPFAGLIYDLFYRVWGHDLLLEHIILNISTNSGWFYMKTFTTGLVFARQSKQGVTTLCFDHNYT